MKNILLILFGLLLNPVAFAQLNKADSLFFAQDYAGAQLVYETNKTNVQKSALHMNRLAYCYHRTGKLQEAVDLYLLAEKTASSAVLKLTIGSRLARVYSLQNKPEESLKWLSYAIKNGYMNSQEMNEDPDFRIMRSDKKFLALRDTVLKYQHPCMYDPKNREFDFWVGEWNVFVTGTNMAAGYSRIEIVSGGCVILENWTSGGGGEGKSMNYIDPATGKWEQTWYGSGKDLSKFVNGVYDGKQMQFTFEKTTAGKKQLGKFHFYDLGKNEVRQMQEASDDEGKTWNIIYDLTYKRVK